MNPLLCRHGVALAVNMAFMFSSEEFNMENEQIRRFVERQWRKSDQSGCVASKESVIMAGLCWVVLPVSAD